MRYPNNLLLGNGINRAFEGTSWDKLLETISVNKRVPEGHKLELPYPLQAVLLTEDHLDQCLKAKRADLLDENPQPEKLTGFLRELLGMGFDHILTTNYTYELENAAAGGIPLTEFALRKLARHTDDVKRVEAKLMCHSFNQIIFRDIENRIWHIHGEARKPDSMILGHYYYAKLLAKMSESVDSRRDRYLRDLEDGTVNVGSWMDAFIMGNVYILGFGFDFSEFDLWWLLNRKKREKAPHGKTVFLAPEKATKDGYDEKVDLLRIMGVEVEHCGVQIQERTGEEDENAKKARNAKYREFYRLAADKLKENVNID